MKRLFLVATALACRAPSAPHDPVPVIDRLTGVWIVELHRDGAPNTAPQRILVGLVPQRRPRQVDWTSLVNPTHLGV